MQYVQFKRLALSLSLTGLRLLLFFFACLFFTVSSRADDVLVQQAAAQYRQAYQNGYITSLIRFEHNTELRYMDTPARAVPDFEEGSCTVFLSPEPAAKLGFDRGSRLRFMVFHEMAHCDLYFSLSTVRQFSELPAQANLLLSDLLELEYLFPHGSRHINGYITYHELYADIKALALMLNEGAGWDDIEAIWLFRRASMASILGSHDSEQMLMQIPLHDWGHLLPTNLEDRVRVLTDRYTVATFIEKAFAPVLTHFAASRQLEGGLRTICSSVMSPWSTPREIAFLKRRLWEGANSPKSLWRDVAAIMNESAGCSEFIEHFFQRRYGKLVQHLDDQDLAIAAWLHKTQ